MDDQLIWENIRRGDTDALKLLHDRYYLQLLHWTKSCINDLSLSEELVSDCFVKLWLHKDHILIEKSIKAYLFLMVRNLIVSQSRKNKKMVVFNSENLPDLPDDVMMDNQDFYAELYQTIKRMPERRRKILELAAFESLTYAEIAEHLNISVNTVKTQMSRAYQFLKEELDPKNFLMFYILRRL